MNWLVELLCNPFLLTGLSSWAVAQITKVIINALIYKKIRLERLIGDGGMPSGHSATVSSLATISALTFGPGSFQFGVTLILAVIVCHDAMGVRRETEKQAYVITEIVKAFEVFSGEDIPEVKLKQFVGHTPIQVLAGILIGISNALLLHFFVFS